jgi:Tfp pilus assembly protein FimV
VTQPTFNLSAGNAGGVPSLSAGPTQAQLDAMAAAMQAGGDAASNTAGADTFTPPDSSSDPTATTTAPADPSDRSTGPQNIAGAIVTATQAPAAPATPATPAAASALAPVVVAPATSATTTPAGVSQNAMLLIALGALLVGGVVVYAMQQPPKKTLKRRKKRS